MRLRSRLGRAALRWSYRLESAAPVLFDAASLRTINRAAFDGQSNEWIARSEEGWLPDERLLFDRLKLRPGKALCLASGAGREAFALARAGFSVLGVEQVESMVAAGSERSRRLGLDVRFAHGDMADPPGGDKFDLVLICNLAYGFVPGRRARVAWLSRLRSMLEAGGRVVASYPVKEPGRFERRALPLLKAAACAAGNPDYELGDRVDATPMFFRLFPSCGIVADEAREAGLRARFFCPTVHDHFAILTPS